MKPRILPLSVLILSLILLTGCDFFRSLAGRPTSAEIEARRERIARHEDSVRAEQARKDSIAALELVREAKRQAADSIRRTDMLVRTPEQVKTLNGVKIGHAYCLMIGTYRNVENATKLAENIRSKGYPADVLQYFSGAVGIGACATDDPEEFLKLLERARKEDFCRSDAWILVNDNVDVQ